MNKWLEAAIGRIYMMPEGDAGGAGGGGGGAGAGAGTGAGAGAQPAWFEGFKSPEVKQWLTAFPKDTFPDAEAVAAKAYNLEKFMGADKAGRGVVVPADDAKPEEWAAFNKKVFKVPDAAEGYKLPDAVPAEVRAELEKDEMYTALRAHAHKTGMPPAVFQQTVGWYVEHMKGMQDKMINELNAEADRDLQALESEWGKEYDTNASLGQRAAKAFIPHKSQDELKEILTKMEGAIGTGLTMRIWAAIGKGIAEDTFVEDGGTGSLGLTREGARAQIAELQKDKAFAAKLASGDADAKAKWNNLHKIGYGEES